MLRASFWQWQRHQHKLEYIKTLQERLEKPVSDINEIIKENTDIQELAYRRFSIEGEYDYEHEIILRNRRFNDDPGSFVITPLKIKDSEKYILVSRGFIPLSYSARDKRTIFRKEKSIKFLGLLKESQTRRFLAPADPQSGEELPWVDGWLRIDIENIAKQLPYPLLPVYAEIMSTDNTQEITAKIIVSKSDKHDIFFLAGKSTIPGPVRGEDLSHYPIAVFDTVVPAGRHLGYVFEWAFMAAMTLLICIILQFRRTFALKSKSSAVN